MNTTDALQRGKKLDRLGVPAVAALLTAGVVLLVTLLRSGSAVLVVLLGAGAILAIGIVPALRARAVISSVVAIAAAVGLFFTAGPVNPLAPQPDEPQIAVLLANSALICFLAAVVLVLANHPGAGLSGLFSCLLLLAASRYAVAQVLDAATEGPEDWTSLNDGLAIVMMTLAATALIALSSLATFLHLHRVHRSDLAQSGDHQ